MLTRTEIQAQAFAFRPYTLQHAVTAEQLQSVKYFFHPLLSLYWTLDWRYWAFVTFQPNHVKNLTHVYASNADSMLEAVFVSGKQSITCITAQWKKSVMEKAIL